MSDEVKPFTAEEVEWYRTTSRLAQSKYGCGPTVRRFLATIADQGERIERLRAGMRHDSTCKKGESRLMACTCGLDTLLKEDDSHV